MASAQDQIELSEIAYLHPQSASISREKLHSAHHSTEQLLHPKSAFSSSKKLSIEDHKSPVKSSSIYQHGHPHLPRRLPKRSTQIDSHVLALSVTITLAILVLIGVPLGAILPQKYVVPLPVNVIMPFYVYPDPGAWDRLYSG